MKKNRILLLVTVLAAVGMLSAAAIMAQEGTEEPPAESTSVPSSFSDNRINGDIFLGGLAMYCEDENGNTDGNTFQNGGITVWGPDGQKYITLTASQLRGDEEIMQPVAEMTDEPMMDATEMVDTDSMDSEDMDEVLTAPILLAQANTMNGPLWFFRTGTDTFALQGYDNTGKFYTYTWEGCALGTLDAGAAPFLVMTPGIPMEITLEVTDDVTAVPTVTETPDATTTPEPTEEVTEAP